MFAALNANPVLLLMCPSSSTHRYWPSVVVPALVDISVVWFHTKSVGRLRCALRLPLHFSSWEWVCLENMSLVYARRLFSCQKILFTFHFYTAPQPHSWAFSSLLHFQKLVPPALAAFPLSISFSLTNWISEPATVVSTSSPHHVLGNKWLLP